jgi:CheY-like chemotaxis protein
MYINDEGKVAHYKESLLKVKGDILRSIDILKELSGADGVDLFIYIKSKDYLYDMVRQNNIPIKFFKTDQKSLIGECYLTKEPIQSKHLSYDDKFNIALDNPYKIPMTAQILIPIIKDNEVLGILRFEKNSFFPNGVYAMILALRDDFKPLFSKESYKTRINTSELYFNLEGTKVNNMLSTIKHYIDELESHSKELEMKKLFLHMQDELTSIYKYLDMEQLKKDKNQLDNSVKNSDDIRILIADDVQINVKILKAMLSSVPMKLDMLYAFDGLETEEIIEKSRKENNLVKIILLDHHMPGKLGLDIAKDLRKYENENNTTRAYIISITNDPEAIKADKGLFDYHIAKPFSKKDLHGVINHIQEAMVRALRVEN